MVGLMASGCSGDDDTTPTTVERVGTSTTVAATQPQVAQMFDQTPSYFDAIAGERPVPETVAVPGSDADIYARFRSTAARLLSADSVPIGTTVTSSTPTGLDVCDPECTTYSSVSVEPSTGRVETFAVDGVPLSGRIVGDGLRADDGGVIGRITSAFRNQAGDVLVVVEIRNTTDVAVDLFGFSAVYQPAGASVSREASGWWGRSPIDPGIGTDLLLAFDLPAATATTVPSTTVALGSGRVSLSGLRGDGVAVALDMALPRAGG